MNKENYDHIISLGYNCEIANSFLARGMREFSFPFDWNFTKMWKINQLLKKKFENFFVFENLEVARYTDNPAMDKDEGITYVHSGSYNNLQKKENYNAEKDKYNRRIDRLLNILESEKKILFVRLTYDDTTEEHQEFIKILEEMYPKSVIKLLVFCMNKNLYVENSKIDYAHGIKLTRYCLGEYIREHYEIPIWPNKEKSYK